MGRRAFARTLLAGGTAAAVAAGAASLPLPAAAAVLSPAAETQAIVTRIVAHYGDRLSSEQKARLPRLVAGHLAMLEPVRAMAQPNAAPPATVLRLVSGR